LICLYTATKMYTLSLHGALPIFQSHFHLSPRLGPRRGALERATAATMPTTFRAFHAQNPQISRSVASVRRLARLARARHSPHPPDRKSTRLNSSHVKISYAVFCF